MFRRKNKKFQQLILSQLDAAHNYAYWLTQNQHDAEDLTQEACLRAYQAFDTFLAQNAKAWLLTIIRNTYFNQVQKQKRRGDVIYLDTVEPGNSVHAQLQHQETPERCLQRDSEQALVLRSINTLADEFREVIVLRELEGLNYKEIASILDCPVGTVMSRLSRARQQIKNYLHKNEHIREVSP